MPIKKGDGVGMYSESMTGHTEMQDAQVIACRGRNSLTEHADLIREEKGYFRKRTERGDLIARHLRKKPG